MGLNIEKIKKSYGNTTALDGISFSVQDGEIVTVLGPSGCGKSTLLATIAGIEKQDSGEIYWNGSSLKFIQPHKRGFGLMFQDYALFPHMNVEDNISFGLRMTTKSSSGIPKRVEEILDMVGLPGFGNRDVNTLSGGEQQRVALARALAPRPRLLMLDEPLGSLDRTLRERLMSELRLILRDLKQTTIYVTHDQEEAFAIADRVVVINAGKIAQIGEPHLIYKNPASIFVAQFLGLNNLLVGTVRIKDGSYSLRTQIGEIPISEDIKGQVTVLVRPDSVQLGSEYHHQLVGTVVERSFRGSVSRVSVEINEVLLKFDFMSGRDSIPNEGEIIYLSYDPDEGIQILK